MIMTERTIHTSLLFRRAFKISGFDAPLPAGTYAVATDERLINGVGTVAYQRVATRLQLPANPLTPGLSEEAVVDPADLAAAHAKDWQ
jgi:hypothetical protein